VRQQAWAAARQRLPGLDAAVGGAAGEVVGTLAGPGGWGGEGALGRAAAQLALGSAFAAAPEEVAGAALPALQVGWLLGGAVTWGLPLQPLLQSLRRVVP
jgi:hypothetical protein